jgi:hypothetical protein
MPPVNTPAPMPPPLSCYAPDPPKQKAGDGYEFDEKDVHVTYESCMASLHATGKPLIETTASCVVVAFHYVRHLLRFNSARIPVPGRRIVQCSRSAPLGSSLLLHHGFLLRHAFLLHHQPWIVLCRAARLLQLACARQTNSTHGFAHPNPNPNPNPNPTTAGLSTTPRNVGVTVGSRTGSRSKMNACV